MGGGYGVEAMDVLSLLLIILFRALVVVLPLTVALLALRRLLLSQSSNAWIYAACCLFAAVTTAGMLPWFLGLASGNWLFFLFSSISPLVWVGVILTCDPAKTTSPYDMKANFETESTVPRKKLKPLILEEPDWPEAPVAVFRHSRELVATPIVPKAEVVEKPASSLLSIARGMRGNSNSDARRPKLLPAPKLSDDNLPFLNRQ